MRRVRRVSSISPWRLVPRQKEHIGPLKTGAGSPIGAFYTSNGSNVTGTERMGWAGIAEDKDGRDSQKKRGGGAD